MGRLVPAVVATALLLALIPAGAAAASPSPGTVVVQENPGRTDYVSVYFPADTDPSTARQRARAVVSEAGYPIRAVETDAESDHLEVKVTTTVGQNRGVFARRVDAGALDSLRPFPDTTVLVALPGVVAVDGPVSQVSAGTFDAEYRLSGPGTLTYRVPGTVLGLAALGVFALAVVPYAAARLYGRRVVAGDGDRADKVHRLRRVVAVGGLALSLVAVVAVLEFGAIPVVMTLLSGLAPWLTAGQLGQLAGIVAAVLLPLLASFVGLLLGVFPYDRRLRDTTIDARSAAKRGLAGIMVGVVPMIGWFVLLVKLPPGLMENRLFLFGVFTVFMALVFAAAPYLVLLVQDTRELTGEDRRLVEAFCGDLGHSLRGVYAIDGQGNKLANAVVAGTLPGFTYVFLTDYLLEEFDDDEIRAVVAHELGHVEAHHLPIRGGLAVAVFGAWILGYDSVGLARLQEQFGFYGFFAPFVVFFLAYLVGVQGLLAVRQEHAADRYAARQTDVETAVSALRHLGEANVAKFDTGRLYNLLNLHPSIEDRIEALRELDAPAGGPGDDRDAPGDD